jgi:gliding motility-associated-like protein
MWKMEAIFYGFMTNNYPGKLLRLNFGNSLLNTPTVTDLGTLGVIPNNTEGVQIVKNGTNWYVIIVGGDPAGGNPSKIVKINLGTNIANNFPSGTDWGNLGNMSYPHDLYVFDDNGHWYGLTVNTTNNTLTRFDFTTSFSNTPTAVNLGNVGNLNGPTGVYAIKDNGNWYGFVTNAFNSTVTRLNFGNSLLNTPTGVNIGNPGNIFSTCWDIFLMKYCGKTLGFVINAASNDLVKLDFSGNITGTPSATTFGNIGNLSFPHCLSKLFRSGPDVYTFIPNVNNNTLSRLRFIGCSSSSIPNSNLQNPGSVTYNTPGTYNINLTLDDGLPTQSAFCKQVVVLPPPTVITRQDSALCAGASVILNTTATGAASYSWSPAAGLSSTTTASPTATPSVTTQYIVTVTNAGGCTAQDTVVVTVKTPQQCVAVTASFSAPDTVCVNAPVNITNNSTGASSYYWNFCVANINTPPTGTNLGNPGNLLSTPVFIDYIFYNNNYYGFLINHSPGGLIRLNFGNSLLNVPTATSLGNFGGIIPPGQGSEGIQMVFNEGRWYAIIVGGYLPTGSAPRILKLDFGPDPTNPIPSVTNWGNIGNMLQPIDLHVFNEGSNWYGFTVNAENNTITRFDFTNSFNNTPTAVNLGNIGNLTYPTGIYAINDNGFWRVFIVNAGNGDRVSGTFSLTRLDFGSSLLNTPVGVNLGNPGNMLHHPRDLTIIKLCGQIVGFAVNGHPNYNDVVKMNFNNNLGATPTITSLGNIGGLNFPHSLSKLFRVGNDVYSFITNAFGNSITRLKFDGCTNSSIPNSTQQNPGTVTYNTPGTYNINLTIDDGLPTQTAYCKQVVVMPIPPHAPNQTISLCQGDSVKIGAATHPGTFLWNNGTQSDSIWVKNSGTYWIETTRSGCSNRDSFVVTAHAKPVVNLGNDTSMCKLDTLVLNAGNPGAGYVWSVGGNTGQTYAAIDTGYYSVQVTSNQCVSKDTIHISLYASPVISIRPDTSFCKGGSVVLTTQASGSYTYSWLPLTGLTGSSTGNPTASPTDTTQYIALATNSFGCKIRDTVNVNVKPVPLVQLGADTAICIGSNITFDAGNLGSGFLWQDASTSETFTTTDTGYYHVKVTRNGCAASDTIHLAFNPQPVFSIRPDTSICKNQNFVLQTTSGGSYTYSWSPSTGLSSISSASPSVLVAGNVQYSCTVTNSFGCQLVRSINITGLPVPLVDLGSDTTVCIGQPVFLNAQNAGATYQWSNGPTSQTNTVTTSGLYKVVVTKAGCSTADSIAVYAKPLPSFELLPDTARLCLEDSVLLNSKGGNKYEWYTDLGNLNVYDSSIVAYPGSGTLYHVIITDSICNVVDTLTSVLSIKPSPALTVDKTNDINCNTPVSQLSVTGASSYLWFPALGITDLNIPDPVVNPQTDTWYLVKGSGANGCASVDSIKVLVQFTGLSNFYIPNAFTPNGDGKNDCFGVRSWGPVETFEFSIFNRWGERVFYTKNTQDCWNGYYKGKLQPNGVFVYYIRVKSQCGSAFKKGTIALIK